MNVRFLFPLLLAASLAGCAYPASSIGQGAEAGHLRFTGQPGAEIRVDGQARGVIVADRPTVVDVQPGKHRVEELMGGRSLLDRNYEIGAGSSLDIGG
jgi:hypothetical protein